MRRSARQADDLDSLNLLLDTVCNMFGIFIFSAMVVALLAATRSTQVAADTVAGAAKAEPTERVVAAEASITALYQRLEEMRSSRTALIAEKADRAGAARHAAEAELSIRQATLDEYRRRLDTDSRLLTDLRDDVPRLRDQIAQMQEAIRRARSLKEVETRTPLRRALEGRIPVQIVLDSGRAFILNSWWDHRSSDSHPCDIWCDWNQDAVDAGASDCQVVKCLRGGEIEIHRKVLLLAGGGIEAESAEKLAADPAWQRFLSSLDPARHVVVLRCTATGFGAFGPVRGEVVGRGVPYNVEPTRLDPFYHDQIIEGVPVGQ